MVDEMSSHGASKMVVGVKRRGEELEEESNGSRKHVKMRDLQSVVQSEGNDTHEPGSSRLEETEEQMDIIETQSSQVLDNNVVQNAEAGLLEGGLKLSSTLLAEHRGLLPLDLNTELCTDENSGYNDNVVCLGDSKEQSSYAKGKAVVEQNFMSLGGNNLDLVAEDVASSVNHDLCNTKTRDASDSGKPTGSVENKDSLQKWKEMKKNGFMSSAFGYGGIPAAPKQRGRKNKAELLKRKMEQAKKEQVDRFTKMAAPSGLLNGLNPGIINHVRNSKQVHSIIQALVRSEKREIPRQAEQSERNTGKENVNISGEHGSSLSYVSSMNLKPESNLLHHNRFSHSPLYSLENRSGPRASVIEGSGCAQPSLQPSLFPYSKIHSEDDVLALKLASSTKVHDNTSCVSNEESANDSSVDTLSVKAATVASQWLQLLHQDIKGRLAALRRSKKRVRAVITTELPFLLSKEFSSNQENDPYVVKDFASFNSTKRKAELHQSYWTKLFNQMDNSLSEEEKQLENWLNQVNGMMLHCDQGLQHIQLNSILEMQQMGILNNNMRSKLHDSEKELSVRAAAASIYSACNFLSSRENVSCC